MTRIYIIEEKHLEDIIIDLMNKEYIEIEKIISQLKDTYNMKVVEIE